MEARRSIVSTSGNRRVFCRECDLTSPASVRRFAETIIRSGDRVDGLINNAGVMRLPRRRVTETGAEAQLATNFLGHFLLTNLLVDKLDAQATPSVVVNVDCTTASQMWVAFRGFIGGNWRKLDLAVASYGSRHIHAFAAARSTTPT